MTLTTHATTATAIGVFIPGPWWLGWSLSFFSHFVLDMIPHYDYDEKGVAKHKFYHFKIHDQFTVNILKVVFDLGLGLLVPLLIGWWFKLSIIYLVGCGAIAILPDFLQLVYSLTKIKILQKLQNFHVWIHSQKKIREPLFGHLQQIIINLLIISLIFYAS